MQVAILSHGLITKAKFEEYLATRSSKRIEVLEEQLAKVGIDRAEKETLQRACADLELKLGNLREQMEKEQGQLTEAVEATENRLMKAEVMKESYKIDLQTRYDQWQASVLVNKQLEAKNEQLKVLLEAKNEAAEREVKELRAALEEVKKMKVPRDEACDVSTLMASIETAVEVKLEGEASLVERADFLAKSAKKWLDEAVEAEADKGVAYALGFLRCR